MLILKIGLFVLLFSCESALYIRSGYKFCIKYRICKCFRSVAGLSLNDAFWSTEVWNRNEAPVQRFRERVSQWMLLVSRVLEWALGPMWPALQLRSAQRVVGRTARIPLGTHFSCSHLRMKKPRPGCPRSLGDGGCDRLGPGASGIRALQPQAPRGLDAAT